MFFLPAASVTIHCPLRVRRNRVYEFEAQDDCMRYLDHVSVSVWNAPENEVTTTSNGTSDDKDAMRVNAFLARPT
jgi:hypothetical protein